MRILFVWVSGVLTRIRGHKESIMNAEQSMFDTVGHGSRPDIEIPAFMTPEQLREWDESSIFHEPYLPSVECVTPEDYEQFLRQYQQSQVSP